jgi:hypothetical protein
MPTVFRRHNQAFAILAAAAIIAVVYWPASHGGFVLDDSTQLHDEAWLRGKEWYTFVFRGFNDWSNYFRPLVVALFAAELGVFDGAAQPMHVVSICLHLSNTLLVGLLAARIGAGRVAPGLGAGVAMLIFGLHPGLIEPVNWVGLQFDLTVVLFMLLGLLLNTAAASTGRRAIAVAGCFFLAACAKEAALAFPILLVMLDLFMRTNWRYGASWREIASGLWREQKRVYIAIALAGVGYLALRFYAIGFAAARPAAEPLLSFARFNKVCLTYLEYWKLLLLPTSAVGPIHPFDAPALAGLTWRTLCIDGVAIAIASAAIRGLWKRRIAGLVGVGISVTLLPVLNFVPFIVNGSLYQDRYAASAIAFACAFVPALLVPAVERATSAVRFASILGASAWLGICAWSVHVTIPAWADDVALCQWALRQHPDSIFAKSQLLDAYLARNDRVHARPLADALVTVGSCPGCLLDAAFLAIADGDAARATSALDKLKDQPVLAYEKTILRKFVFANALLLDLEKKPDQAAAALHDAIEIDAFDPEPWLALASLQARAGDPARARETAEHAFSLLAPDQREARKYAFERELAGAR